MNQTTNRVYEFGAFRLESAERLLVRGGKPVPLTPKAFDTLLTLLESSGRLMKKDDLIKQVWPDAIVEEANLARTIWMIRKALGDDNGRPVFIETIPKMGYRFVAPVTELPPKTGRDLTIGNESVAPVTVEPIADPPPSLPQSKRRSRRMMFVTGVLAAGLIVAGVFKLWKRPAQAAGVASGLTFLTDGRHADLGAYWAGDGRIYYSRFVTSTRVETWTMNGDGTGQHRANTEIKNLLSGRWSPDGKKVVFAKEQAPGTIYVADADGRNEVALPFATGNMDWSPDGSRFVYQARMASGDFEIFLYTLQTGASIALTPGMAVADPSFSYDGTLIAFTSWRDGNAEIYVMNSDGSGVRRLTNHPAFDNYPVFSPDGTQVAFQSNREDEHFEIYLQDLNANTPPIRLTKSNGVTGLFPKCWALDGTRMLVYTDRNGTNQIAVIDVEPVPARLVLKDPAADLASPRLSADGKRLLHEARLIDGTLELRVLDLQTKHSRAVFKTSPGYPTQFHLEPAWSRDDSLIAFCDKVAGNSDIFTVRSDGRDLRNVSQNRLRESTPVFSPDGDIVFARDSYGQAAHLYRMDSTGGQQRRVTDAAGYEMAPAFSPDGTLLAFAADRKGRGLDIVLIELNASRSERLLAGRRSHDTSPVFSRDGSRLAFVANSDGNPEIYVMNPDGTGLSRRTHTREEERVPFFSSDGQSILFSSNRTGKFALYQVPAR